jgi:hypothetical protein
VGGLIEERRKEEMVGDKRKKKQKGSREMRKEGEK